MDRYVADEEKRPVPAAAQGPDADEGVSQPQERAGGDPVTSVCHTTDTVIYTSPEFSEVENTVDHYHKLKPGEPCKLKQRERTI